jgi:hypothetical protein
MWLDAPRRFNHDAERRATTLGLLMNLGYEQ